MREMLYVPREASAYCVRVTVRKGTGEWTTCKYRADTLLWMASGPDFTTAMLQTTLVGRNPDEPGSERRPPV